MRAIDQQYCMFLLLSLGCGEFGGYLEANLEVIWEPISVHV